MTEAVYFEPPSRIQLVDKLSHLVRYSDFLIVITGPDQIGKTMLADQLAISAEGTTAHPLFISLDDTCTPKGLIQHLAHALSLEATQAREALLEFTEHVRGLNEVGQQLLIIIDNAEWLTDEAVELLTNMVMLGKGRPQLVLSGTDALVNRLVSLEVPETLDGRLHVETLHPLDDEESEAFLEHLHLTETMPSGKALKQILSQSEGVPGQLIASLTAFVSDNAEALDGNEHTGGARKRALPLPMPHLLGIGGVLALILGISLWQMFPGEDEPSVPSVGGRISEPLALNLSDDQAPENAPLNLPDERSELSKRLAEQEARLDEQPAPAPVEEVAAAAVESSEPLPVDPEPVSSPEVTPVLPPTAEQNSVANNDTQVAETVAQVAPKPSEPKVAPTAPEPQKPAPKPEQTASKPAETPVKTPDIKATPEPKVEKPKPVATATKGPAERWLKEDQLMQWPTSGFTLQVLGAREEASVARFMAGLKNPNRLYYFRTVYKGQPWHVVVYGQYASKSAANRAVSSLPEELKSLKPWSRSIKGVQQDIQKK